jgi:FkbM family methyltransferase
MQGAFIQRSRDGSSRRGQDRRMTLIASALAAVAIGLALLAYTVVRQFAAYGRQIDELRTQLAEDRRTDRMREELHLGLNEISADLRNHTMNVGELVRAHSNQVTAAVSKFVDASQCLPEILEKLRGLYAQAPEWLSRLDSLSTQSSTAAGRLSELMTHVADIEPGAAALRERLDQNIAQSSTAAGQLSDLATRAEQIETGVAALRERLDQNTAQSSAAARQLSDLTTRAEQIETGVAALRERLDQNATQSSTAAYQLSDLTTRAADIETGVGTLWERMDRNTTAVSALGEASTGTVAAIAALSQRVSDTTAVLGTVTEMGAKLSNFGDAVEILLRRAPHDFPIDQELLGKKTEPEMKALAETIAILRPLIPYPRWRFDADWSNPDLAFQVRQRVWQHFHDRRSEAPIEVGWHYGTRLRVYLGNDLSRQIFIAGCIDPNEFAFLDRLLQPGMTFLDTGANEGIYSVFAAKRVGGQGMVWAFEPSGRELERLRRNLELNNLEVRVFPLALAERCGEAELTVAGYEHAGQNTLGKFANEGIEVARTETVRVERLDDIVAAERPARIDVIKADVEGAELRLFRGARATLRQYRPILLFEVSAGSLRHQDASVEELLDYLRDQEYTLFFFDPRTGLPAPAPPQRFSDNMIAVPAETSLPEAIYRSWPEM